MQPPMERAPCRNPYECDWHTPHGAQMTGIQAWWGARGAYRHDGGNEDNEQHEGNEDGDVWACLRMPGQGWVAMHEHAWWMYSPPGLRAGLTRGFGEAIVRREEAKKTPIHTEARTLKALHTWMRVSLHTWMRLSLHTWMRVSRPTHCT